MAINVKGIYEDGIVRLTEPVPEGVAARTPQEVEVSFERISDPTSEDEAAVLAELDRIEAEIEALGDPKDDTPEERKRRVDLLSEGFSLGPPLTDEEATALEEATRRPMSMFHLDDEQQ